MAESLTDEQRAARRYAKKPRTPNPTTAELIVGRDKLRKGLEQQSRSGQVPGATTSDDSD